MACVYMVVNRINDKRYVGKTVRTLADRQTVHERDTNKGSKLLFHNVLRKYGFNAFKWKVLFDDVDEDELDSIEIATIKLKKSKAPNGYNLTDGGDGTSGWKHSPKTKLKISRAHIGKIVSLETREKLRKINVGKCISEETKAKMSASLKGRKGKSPSEETRTKISESLKGRKPSEETRAKLSRVRKGKKHSIEARAKMSRVQKGRKITKEHREKLSKAHSGKVLSPEHKASISKAMQGNTHRLSIPSSLESRCKHSKTLKQLWKNPEFRAKMMASRKHKSLVIGG